MRKRVGFLDSRFLTRISIFILVWSNIEYQIAFSYSYRRFKTCQRFLRMNSWDESIDNKSIFIFGLGYVGSYFAKSLIADGWKVSGTCTNFQKIQTFRDDGINAYMFDDETGPMIQSEATNDLLSSSCVLSTIPPCGNPTIDPVIRYHGMDLRKGTLSRNLEWIGYLSSTGVYGDRNGAWVSENDKVCPENSKTSARADAESSWIALQERNGLPVHVFRLAGIYGPNRNAIETLIKANGNMEEVGGTDDSVFISRIHVDDICSVLKSSMRLSLTKTGVDIDGGLNGGNQRRNPILLNVADSNPATRYEVLSYSCRLLGYPVVEPNRNPNNPGSWSSRGGSKRVDNTLMLRLLEASNMTLKHPDYRKGLDSVLKQFKEEGKLVSLDPSSSSSSLDPKSTGLRPQLPPIIIENSESIRTIRTTSERVTEPSIEELRGEVRALRDRIASLEEESEKQRVLMTRLARRMNGIDKS